MTDTPQAGDAGPELLLQWLECRAKSIEHTEDEPLAPAQAGDQS